MRVLVTCAEPVGARMAGPAIRARELAGALAGACDVTLAAPAPSEVDDERIALLEAGLADYDALLGAIGSHDVVVTQLLPPRLLAKVWRMPARLAVDLYNPTVVEVLEAARGRSAAARERRRRVATRAATAHLAAADFVLCASEQQRDLWLGGMALRELLAPEDLDADPDLSRMMAVVPFGVPSAPPVPGPGLRAALPAIGRGDRVLLWGGGIWDWLDAPTAIRAAGLLADRDPPVHLVFGGIRRPALAPRDEHRATAEAIALARELGPRGAERALPRRLGAVRAAGRLAARRRPRRVGAPGAPGVALRVPDADRRLPVGRPPGRGDRRRRARRARAGARAWAAPWLPAIRRRSRPRARSCSTAAPSGSARRSRAVAEELRWDRVVAPLLEFCLHGAKRSATAARRHAWRSHDVGPSDPANGSGDGGHETGVAALGVKLARNAARAVRGVGGRGQ